jgi:hypothetical protein
LRYETSTRENFHESRYLFTNPDVLDGINRGEFKTAFEHFERNGLLEGRCQKLEIKLDAPLGIVHVPKTAGTSLREEINLFHSSIYKGQKYTIRDREKMFFPITSLEKKSKELNLLLKIKNKNENELMNLFKLISGTIS